MSVSFHSFHRDMKRHLSCGNILFVKCVKKRVKSCKYKHCVSSIYCSTNKGLFVRCMFCILLNCVFGINYIYII